MHQIKPTGNPLFPCTKRENFCAISAQEQNLCCAPYACWQEEEKVAVGKLIACDTQAPACEGDTSVANTCHIFGKMPHLLPPPPIRCTKTQTPRSVTANLLTRGFQAGPMSLFCIQDSSMLRAQNGPVDHSLQSSVCPLRAPVSPQRCLV